jgi:hypothetical protein
MKIKHAVVTLSATTWGGRHLYRILALSLSAVAMAGADPVSDEIFPSEWLLDTKVDYAAKILSQQETIVDKAPFILESYRNGTLEAGKIYLSGYGTYSHYAERTDTPGKFPILGRFPKQHTSGRSANEDILDTADFSLTYAPTEWMTVFAHGIYTDLHFPSQEESQLREGFVTLGNLKECPWYLSVGKMTVNFGHQGAYNPITHSVNNHFYRADAYDVAAELGYVGENWQVAMTALNGGRQLRVADTPSGTFGSNFAVSGRYFLKVASWDVSVGGGYLYSSIYDSDDANHPGVHSNVMTTRQRNGVINAWVEAKNGPFSLMAEYSQNERDWPASGGSVNALTLGAAYDTEAFDNPTRISLVYGRGKLGNEGDQFESLHQLAVGVETFITPNFALSAEFVYNRSFIPLIMLDRVADEDVDTETFIFSGKLFF